MTPAFLHEPNTETTMNRLKQLWTWIARFIEALEGMDDPVGDYMFSLGKRVEKLEGHLGDVESRLHSHLGGGNT